MQIELNKSAAIFDIIDGDIVIINLINGNYYNLTGSGAHLWKLIVSTTTSNELTDSLTASFEVDEKQAEKDIAIFLAQLEKESLIIKSDINQNIKPQSKNTSSNRKSYQAPILETFSDMQDFLLVDPIHEVDENGLPKYTPPTLE